MRKQLLVVVVWLVILSLFAGRSTGRAFGNCYANCFSSCCYSPFQSIFCSGKCLRECASAAAFNPTDFNHRDTRYFCKLGCATSLCTKFSSNTDPAEKKVESCVDSCSRTCTNT